VATLTGTGELPAGPRRTAGQRVTAKPLHPLDRIRTVAESAGSMTCRNASGRGWRRKTKIELEVRESSLAPSRRWL